MRPDIGRPPKTYKARQRIDAELAKSIKSAYSEYEGESLKNTVEWLFKAMMEVKEMLKPSRQKLTAKILYQRIKEINESESNKKSHDKIPDKTPVMTLEKFSNDLSDNIRTNLRDGKESINRTLFWIYVASLELEKLFKQEQKLTARELFEFCKHYNEKED
jgi:hypothetical protein